MKLQIRPAIGSDFEFFFRLKCEPKNILWTGHTAPPARERLRAWFAAQLVSATRTILIGEANGQAVGYAYVDVTPDCLDTSVAVGELHEGQGIGRRLIHAVGQYCRQQHPGKPLHAWILTHNVASIRAHEHAGYRRTDHRREQPLDDGRLAEMILFVWE